MFVNSLFKSQFDIFNTFNDYYVLYIYLNDSLSESIKNMYHDFVAKHNKNIDDYFENNDKCYDAGFDILCPENIYIDKLSDKFINNVLVDYKINMCMKYSNTYVGYYIYSRSSTPLKTPLRLANSVGIIDSGYRGNIKTYFDIYPHDKQDDYTLTEGMRYVQICPPSLAFPMYVKIVDNYQDLGLESYRSSGGFGSTGN